MSSESAPQSPHRFTSFRLLWDHFRQERMLFLFSMILFQIKHSVAWVMPILMARIIDLIAVGQDEFIRKLTVLVVVMAIVIGQNVPVNTLFFKYLAICIRNMEYRLRETLVNRVHILSMNFYSRYPIGKLQTKIIRDVEMVGELMYGSLHTLLMAGTSIIAAVIITLIKAPFMLLFFAVLAPLCSILVYLFKRKLELKNKEYRKDIEHLSSHVGGMLEMLPISRAHAVEDYEKSIAFNRISSLKTSGLQRDVVAAFFNSSAYVTFILTQGIFLIIAVWFARRNSLTVGDVVLFQGLLSGITAGINMLLNTFPRITAGFESLHSLAELLCVDDFEPYKGSVKPVVRGNLSLQGVTYTFPGINKPAVDDFSLTVHEGETIGVVGPSGSGKTTLISLLLGYRKPQQGTIQLDGIDFNNIDIREYRKNLSFVSQKSVAFAGTIRDNINYGIPFPSEEPLRRAISMADAESFIASFPQGLDTVIGESGATLSGGQLQRIALARALIRNPRILLLDEATSSLDVFSEKTVQASIEKARLNRTTFIVAHRLSTVMNADRIVVMKEGTILEVGTPQALLASHGEFFAMHRMLQGIK